MAAEKNLSALKTIMAGLPSNTRLAFVGDGPERTVLQQEFADMPNVQFMVRLGFRENLNCTRRERCIRLSGLTRRSSNLPGPQVEVCQQ